MSDNRCSVVEDLRLSARWGAGLMLTLVLALSSMFVTSSSRSQEAQTIVDADQNAQIRHIHELLARAAANNASLSSTVQAHMKNHDRAEVELRSKIDLILEKVR